MLKIKHLSLSILFIPVVVCCALAQEKPEETRRKGETLPIVIGSTFRLNSKVYRSPREINIWTPPSYSKGVKRYPVLYLVDGGLDQDFHHISGLAQLATINLNFEELIVVGIKTENRYMELTQKPKDPRYITKPARAGKSDQFFKHISAEVIPFVEKNYRTSDRKTLIGESLAGLFVTEVFLRHPRTFTDFVSVSPSLWWDDKALAKEAGQLLKDHNESSRRLYITMANEGGTMQGGLDMVLAAIKKTKPKGLDWKYVDRSKTDTHATIYHGAALDALRWLYGIEPPKQTETPWYMVEGGQPPKN